MPRVRRIMLKEFQEAIAAYRLALKNQNQLNINCAKEKLVQCILDIFE